MDPEQQAHLDAIKQSPESDVLFGAYCDWLTDRGWYELAEVKRIRRELAKADKESRPSDDLWNRDTRPIVEEIRRLGENASVGDYLTLGADDRLHRCVGPEGAYAVAMVSGRRGNAIQIRVMNRVAVHPESAARFRACMDAAKRFDTLKLALAEAQKALDERIRRDISIMLDDGYAVTETYSKWGGVDFSSTLWRDVESIPLFTAEQLREAREHMTGLSDTLRDALREAGLTRAAYSAALPGSIICRIHTLATHRNVTKTHIGVRVANRRNDAFWDITEEVLIRDLWA